MSPRSAPAGAGRGVGAESYGGEALGVLCDPRRRAPWGRPRRGGADRKLPGKPRAWPGEERGHGTPAREGQTVRSAFAGFPGQRGEGRSAANFGVEFTVVGALRVERGDVGECLGLGARGRGWVCGFQSVAGAWCVVSSWVRTPWVQVSGLWVLTPTGTSIDQMGHLHSEPHPRSQNKPEFDPLYFFQTLRTAEWATVALN